VVLNTYNRASSLRLVLAAFERQTARDFEVVVADDGSSDDTASVIERARGRASFPIVHVGTAREGHWRTRILNEGIKAARHDLLLFTDADSLPKADLLEVHLRAFDPRRLSIGGCVRLTKEETRGVGPAEASSGAYERFLDWRSRGRLLARHWKNEWQIWTRRRRRPHNLALNMAASRSALVEVNGFDERMRGWGNADGDLRERLKEVGVLPKSVWHRAVVFHLWHPPDPTRLERRNADYARREAIPARCELGLLKPGEAHPAPPSILSPARPGGAYFT
jgi:glycosyltransferase involved in cell wall biosynthesis